MVIRNFLIACSAIVYFFAHSGYAAEISINAGIQNHSVELDTGDAATDNQDSSDSGFHLGISIKNTYGQNKNHYFGVGIDLDDILGDQVIGYRALDYERAFGNHWRAGAFFGAATLDSGLPQNGYYTGFNLSYDRFFENLGLSFEVRHGNGLARDRLLSSDPGGEKPDIFLDYTAVALQLRWTF